MKRAIARERAAVDPSSREARGRLAAMVTRLLEHWTLTATEQAEVLGLSAGSRSTLGRYRSGEPLASNQRGPWWNAGASHMHAAFPKSWFESLGLVSLLDTVQRLQRVS